MSRNCFSGVPMDWLLLFLLLLSDLTSAVDNPYLQTDTKVCTGQPAHFRWKYNVKSFAAVVWNHEEKRIASSPSLSFPPEVIISDQFKGRLTFNATDPFSFILEKATKEDSGMYECVFLFDDGDTDSLRGKLEVKDFLHDDSLLEVEENDECVKLLCKADPPCIWTYPNGTSEKARQIHYCSIVPTVTIKCEDDHDCKYAKFTNCSKSNNNREKRSSEDTFCLRDGSKTEGTDPINPVPIVLGVLGIIAIAVITVIIVFYKRRSRTPREREPPGSDNLDPLKDYKE